MKRSKVYTAITAVWILSVVFWIWRHYTAAQELREYLTLVWIIVFGVSVIALVLAEYSQGGYRNINKK